MKRYLLNKLNKISINLHKSYTEPHKILFIHQNKNKIITTLTYDSKISNEKYFFKTEHELEEYIKEHNIQNVIENICIDKI